ncbi:hypothetical protein OD657_004735 [Salmonella enterica]|nr:hypothetical protein [Salmonella enterica]EJF5731408.1 hypothetical protein [Salmonella enterica]EJX4431047.1 hypothetical protein [Salmonella enterica]EJX4862364.1 hypothetical protein [Salmonella enterica]
MLLPLIACMYTGSLASFSHLAPVQPGSGLADGHDCNPAPVVTVRSASIGTIINSVDMKTGDIKVYNRSLQSQMGNHLLREYLAERGNIGFKQGIQTSFRNIVSAVSVNWLPYVAFKPVLVI